MQLTNGISSLICIAEGEGYSGGAEGREDAIGLAAQPGEVPLADVHSAQHPRGGDVRGGLLAPRAASRQLARHSHGPRKAGLAGPRSAAVSRTHR